MLLIKDIPEDGIMFYDLETDSQYCQYCRIRLMSYQVGLNNEPMLVEDENREDFRKLLASDIMKVSFNGINFDDVVLMREGYYVNPKNRHDMFLAIKTVAPMLPAFGLKFINLHFFADWHEPERRLRAWRKKNKKEMWEAPDELLGAYCKHDVKQTTRVFRLIWEIVQREDHWETYKDLELAMGEPLHEMILFGGEYINIAKIDKEIVRRVAEISTMAKDVYEKTKDSEHPIYNPMSYKQVQDYLGVEHAPKSELLGGEIKGIREDLSEDDYKSFDEDLTVKDVKKLIYDVRDNTKVIGYLRSYSEAAKFERDNRNSRDRNFFVRESSDLFVSNSTSRNNEGRYRSNVVSDGQGNNGDISSKTLTKIPKSYSLSGARTRRFISSSKFGINFQNQNKKTKIAQRIPKGWLGVFIDSTQIENVVHIWASKDDKRRKAYESERNWNEYVWLCNQVLGTNFNKEELESRKSSVNPEWSVYKQYKTAKLALNFGMGPDKFSVMSGISKVEAARIFADIHRACPAIHQLQEIVRKKILSEGRVRDPWGHIYTGSPKQAYKIVSYLVQGCGTGSVPKAMIIACYETIHKMDTPDCRGKYSIFHPYKHRYSYACLCGTTHDELSLRISLNLPTRKIVEVIRDLMYNMEGRFSDRFDGIPLKAKLAVSITTAAEQVELDHLSNDFYTRLIRDYIEVGKWKAGIL